MAAIFGVSAHLARIALVSLDVNNEGEFLQLTTSYGA